MQERLARRLDLPRHPQRAHQRGEHALGGEEVGPRRLGVAPARGPQAAGEQRAEVLALGRQAVEPGHVVAVAAPAGVDPVPGVAAASCAR